MSVISMKRRNVLLPVVVIERTLCMLHVASNEEEQSGNDRERERERE